MSVNLQISVIYSWTSHTPVPPATTVVPRLTAHDRSFCSVYIKHYSKTTKRREDKVEI